MAAKHAAAVMIRGFTPDEKAAAYAAVNEKLDGFFAKYPGIDVTARMATLNSFLATYFPYWHFVGYYVVREIDGSKILHIGPYQGKVLATAIIPFGKGQCGACAAEEKTQIQEDVSTCANYIPCDDVTRSEIVVPVYGSNYHNEPDAALPAGVAAAAAAGGAAAADAAGVAAAAASAPAPPKKLIAVLDIDSEVLAAFDATDKKELEALLAKWI